MRKVILLVLALCLLAPRSALAEGLSPAAPVDLYEAFERYQSYKMEEDTGEWSAYGLIATQLLTTVERGGARGYTGGGVCVLYPGVRGNRDLTLAEPVLYVCLVRGAALGADALSITAGGARYDFTATPEKIKIGSYACERFALPLNGDGMALIRGFAASGGEVRVYSEKRTFRTSIHESDSYRNAKQRVEALSVAAVRDFLSQFDEHYALWDLNEAHWSENRPKMKLTPLNPDSYSQELPALEPLTQCLDVTKRAAVKQYQQLLRDGTFLTAKPNGAFGKATRDATKRAQQYHDLLPTGMPDRVLIELLFGMANSSDAMTDDAAVQMPTEDAAAIAGIPYQIDGKLTIRIDRTWIARALSPSRAADSLNWVEPSDHSNRLYVADGEITNQSSQALQLPDSIQGRLLVDDGPSYPCTLQVERDEGLSFGMELLPLAKSRLVLFAEIPEGLTDISRFSVSLSVQTADGPLVLKYSSYSNSMY